MIVATGISFYPRGGSAYAVRAATRELDGLGHAVHLFSGSMGLPGADSNADTFYTGRKVHALSYDEAVRRHEAGLDAMDGSVPMHASYERKAGAPDRDFSAVDPAHAPAAEAAWARLFADAALRPDVLHLHHLTPMSVAARRVWPGVPVVTTLHGTELKWIARTVDGDPATTTADHGNSAFWLQYMGDIARSSDRLTVLNHADASACRRLLSVDRGIAVVPGGVDTDVFRARRASATAFLDTWTRWLSDDNHATDARGSRITYPATQVRDELLQVGGAPRLPILFAGRYLKVKRLEVLFTAYAALRRQLGSECPALVVWGGRDGECEGEHPHSLLQREGPPGVFLTGAREQADLAEAMSLAQLFVLPSVGESFGQVYLEALATGTPIVATRTGAPQELFGNLPLPVGWLVEPDDAGDLATALLDAVTHPDEAARRGDAGRELALSMTWGSAAAQLSALFDDVVQHATQAPG